MGIKPGWILLALALVYALLVSTQLSSARNQTKKLQAEIKALKATVEQGPEGLMLPLPGACLPKSPDNLPGAPREYRKGLSPGFVFSGTDACVPVVYGTSVVAAGSGRVVKAEKQYRESTPSEFAALLKAVANGANPRQMDRLRGREVWIRHLDGSTTVYAHLSAVAEGLEAGTLVKRGEYIGRVGNSGTQLAALGSRSGARLLFELWDGEPDVDSFFGQGERPAAVLAKAKLKFSLP